MARSPSRNSPGRAPGALDGPRPTATKDGGLEESRRRRERALRLGVVAVVLLGGGLVARAWQGRDSTPSPSAAKSAAADLAAASGLGALQPPPWPAPTDAPARAKLAGLQLGAMGTAEHYHVHLDVIANGQPVPVPANLGVDDTNGAMSFLHTHTADGVVHIEAGRAGQVFTLGQLFTQWDVRLTANQVGSLKTGGDNTLAVYVDGKAVPGNPAALRLSAHQQIALVYGPAGHPVGVPTSYNFLPGD